MHFMRI